MVNFANERTMTIGNIPLQFPPAVAIKNIFVQVNGHTKYTFVLHLSYGKHSTDVQRHQMVFTTSIMVIIIYIFPGLADDS